MFSGLVLFLLIIVGIVVHNIFTSANSKEVINKTEDTTVQLSYNLDLMLEDASRSSLALLYNKELINILQEYDKEQPVFYKQSNHVKVFSLFLSSIIFDKEQFYGVHIFTQNGQLFSHMDQFRIRESISLHDQEWYMKAKEQEGGWLTYYDEDPIYYKNSDKEYLSLLRLLRNPEDQKELGLIKIDFSPKYIEEITEQLRSEYWQITTKNKVPILGNKTERMLYECNTNRTIVKDKESNKSYMCITHTSKNTGFTISNLISTDYLYKEVKEFNRFLSWLIGVCLLFSLIISFYMSHYLLKPLELLKTRIRLFQHDKGTAHSAQDEIGELRIAYDGMLSEINDLVTEAYEINRRNNEAEFKALQSQMDPHFIFNTLESINMKAVHEDQFELSDMIVELGKLIRYRLRNEDQQIPLDDEIKFAKIYVNILQHRLEEALEVEWHVEEGTEEILVPKYIIQPLIENTIAHAYNKTAKKVTISICIKREQNKLHISVKDNGKGIEAQRLSEIQTTLEQNDVAEAQQQKQHTTTNNIALVNIDRRLKLLHGEASGLKISSSEGIGTNVTIMIKVGD